VAFSVPIIYRMKCLIPGSAAVLSPSIGPIRCGVSYFEARGRLCPDVQLQPYVAGWVRLHHARTLHTARPLLFEAGSTLDLFVPDAILNG
jgi:hypothetical protein